jgi:hypothetical protein
LNIECFEQIDEISRQLNSRTDDKAVTAKDKISLYKMSVEQRNKRQEQLNKIIGTERAYSAELENQFKVKKEELQKRHRELCGEYFGDSRGQLDQAWKKHQSEGTETAKKAYEDLEAERKKTEAQLWVIDQQIAIPASATHTYEVLTADTINAQIAELQKTLTNEATLSGVADWRTLAYKAGQATMHGAGYLFMVQ